MYTEEEISLLLISTVHFSYRLFVMRILNYIFPYAIKSCGFIAINVFYGSLSIIYVKVYKENIPESII